MKKRKNMQKNNKICKSYLHEKRLKEGKKEAAQQ